MELSRQLFVAFAALLLGFGLLMVHSSSVTSWPTEFEQVHLSRHLVFLVIGVIAARFAASQHPEFWKRFAPLLFVITVALLILVLVPGIGVRVKGAQRWIRIAVPLGLIEPDLGTAVFLLGSATLVLFLGGWPLRNFLLGIGVCVPVAIGTLAMKPYQQRRVTGFLESWANFDAAPYQLKQSLVTLGAGGLHGVGLGRGWQKLSFLPEANTDFVFAVIGEELGLIGTLSLIALWCGLYLSGLRMLNHLDRRRFAYLASFTLLTQLTGQAMLNIAVVTAMVPPKGISHPLISAGGSNLIVSLLAIGIVLSLSRNEAPEPKIAPT